MARPRCSAGRLGNTSGRPDKSEMKRRHKMNGGSTIVRHVTCDSPSVTRLLLSSVKESDCLSSAMSFFSSSHSSSCLNTFISSASPRSSPSLAFTCGILGFGGCQEKTPLVEILHLQMPTSNWLKRNASRRRGRHCNIPEVYYVRK